MEKEKRITWSDIDALYYAKIKKLPLNVLVNNCRNYTICEFRKNWKNFEAGDIIIIEDNKEYRSIEVYKLLCNTCRIKER